MAQKITRGSVLAAAASLMLAGGLAACNNDNITTLNKNPNAPETAPAGSIFTQAVVNAGRMVGNTFDLRQMEFLVQHVAEVQYPDEDRYNRIRASDTQGSFVNPYVVELKDFQQVIKQGKAQNAAGVWAPASIMTQWEFDYITAAWGNIPYSKALLGDSAGAAPEVVLTPTYDAQKDVYNGMLTALTTASSALTNATGSLGSADIVYGGNNAQWQKFANSLRLRIAIQLTNADLSKADAELKAALQAPGGTFASNADNARIPYPGDGVFDNPWSVNFQTRDDHRMSKTFVDILAANNDPRLPMFAEPTLDFTAGKSTEKYAGQPNGLTASKAGTYFSSTSRLGQFIYPAKAAFPSPAPSGLWPGLGPKQAANMLTYAEVSFIKAEAAERGLGGLTAAQAKGFYEDGIRASIQQWAAATGIAVTDAQIADYIAGPNVAYKGGVNGLLQIAQQKYIALFLDGAQAWFEYRRTCVPALVPGPDALYPTVPRRLEYPVLEKSYNGANLAAAIAAQGPDNMQTKVYIDKPENSPTCAVQPIRTR